MKDAQGNDIPGSFTQEEVDAKVAEATQAANAASEEAKKDLEVQLESTQIALQDIEIKLAGMDDKDKNFAALKAQKEALESQTKGLDDKIKIAIAAAVAPLLDDTHNETLDKLSGGNEDLKKKIEHEFNIYYKDKSATKKSMVENLIKAYKSVAEDISPSVLNSVVSSKPKSPADTKLNLQGEPDPELVEAGKMFNITSADIKKHLPKAQEKMGVMTDKERKFQSA